MHYAPTRQTLAGEPECIWPFLGCSRFEAVIDHAAAHAAFHGHAHLGHPVATTSGGVPVFNVALPILRREHRAVRLWSTPRPQSNETTALAGLVGE